MHSSMKVTGLSLRQWDFLQSNVKHGHRFRAGEVRVCAEFELTPDMASVHVESPIADLAGMLIVLQGIEQAAQAEAILTDAETIVVRVTGPDVEENQPIGGRVVVRPTEAERMAEVALEEHEPDLLEGISEHPSIEKPDK